MDVLDDLERAMWGEGANGVVELVNRLVTLALSAFVLRRTWVRLRARAGPVSQFVFRRARGGGRATWWCS
jgi:hypothetical protein